MSGLDSPESPQLKPDDAAPDDAAADHPQQPDSENNPTQLPPETKTKKPAGALAVVLTCALVFAMGMGSGYLNWGTTEIEVRPTAATSPTPAAKPKRVVGSRENPLPIGTEVTIEDWTFTLGEPQNGTQAIADESESNDPPREGYDFIVVPLTAMYQGKETGIAQSDLKVMFVGDDARTYDGECPLRRPNSISDVDELYNGGVAAGNYCVEVPQDLGGLWVVKSGFSQTSDTIFFDAE